MARKLGPEEKALWGRVVETVKPLQPDRPVKASAPTPKPPISKNRSPEPVEGRVSVKRRSPSVASGSTGSGLRSKVAAGLPPTSDKPATGNLDSTWDRRIHKGGVIPDISVDLHETNLSGAYARLDRTLEQAIHQKLRIILLVTGKPRGHDRTSGQGRGAIAAVVRDWLAASRHASHISAVRQAHSRHGGDGALYIVLKR
jgi:DNA-nicking Smr family endonuclease